MQQGRRSQHPPLAFTPEPERIYLGRRRRNKAMGDNNGPPTVEDLMRQLEAMRLRNEAVEAARLTAERG